MDKEIQPIFNKYFKFLENEHGFKVIDSSYSPDIFGNWNIKMTNGDNGISIISDRKEILVQTKTADMDWRFTTWDCPHTLEGTSTYIKQHIQTLFS